MRKVGNEKRKPTEVTTEKGKSSNVTSKEEQSMEIETQLMVTHPILPAQQSWTWSAMSGWYWELSWVVEELWRKALVLRMKLKGMKVLWLCGSGPF